MTKHQTLPALQAKERKKIRMSAPPEQERNGLLLDGFGKPLDRVGSVAGPVTDTTINVAQGIPRVPDVDTVAINTVSGVAHDAVPRDDSRHAETPMWLIPSRPALPTLDRTKFPPASGLARGGYVLAEGRRLSRPTWCRDGGTPDVILLTTGSEVRLALAAREQLHADGISTRVVSMPCRELFDRQSQQYRDDVLPPSVTARVAVEQASTLGWDRYVGNDGAVVMHTFGGRRTNNCS